MKKVRGAKGVGGRRMVRKASPVGAMELRPEKSRRPPYVVGGSKRGRPPTLWEVSGEAVQAEDLVSAKVRLWDREKACGPREETRGGKW